jgi:hypothetical protein
MNAQEAIIFMRTSNVLIRSSDNKLYQGIDGIRCINQELKDPEINPNRTFEVDGKDSK